MAMVFITGSTDGLGRAAVCRRSINQGFVDLFGQQSSVLVLHL
jgi:NAD(P)-dependent dehydrogenase (short-subunit alcohol dehydrogenase family)